MKKKTKRREMVTTAPDSDAMLRQFPVLKKYSKH